MDKKGEHHIFMNNNKNNNGNYNLPTYVNSMHCREGSMNTACFVFLHHIALVAMNLDVF